MQEADAPANPPADPGSSFQAWQKRTLAAFTAFLRSHYMVLAPLASQVQELLGSDVPGGIKEVVTRHLCM